VSGTYLATLLDQPHHQAFPDSARHAAVSRQAQQTEAHHETRIDETIRELRTEIAAAAGGTVAVKIDVESDLPAVMARADQIELVLLNLIIMARNSMQNGGALAITASRVRRPVLELANGSACIRLSLCDTGDGLDHDAPALRSNRRSVRGEHRPDGCLERVHRLVAGLGGCITVSSMKDVGTRVDLWLPAQ
jgi:nitrogen-specific signal transduction histidine kinase